ncbi:SDR family NAD(P)-dependent oxidoreductase, partial [Bacillus pumilus]
EGLVARRCVIRDRSDIDEQGLSLLKKQHSELLTFQADVSSWESVQQMISAAERELGGIAHLVYSAGMTKSLPFLEVDFSLWKKTLLSLITS